MEMTRILVPVDYSKASRYALQFATSLARDTGAALLIAHVTQREAYPVGELFDEAPRPDPAELHELKAIVPTDPQVKFEHRLVYGEAGTTETVKPANEIVKLADKEQVDAIVIGTHGRSGFSHLGGAAQVQRAVLQAEASFSSSISPTSSSKTSSNVTSPTVFFRSCTTAR